jgi:hypothetical protein
VTKNLCVNLLDFLGVHGKTKDIPEAREDSQIDLLLNRQKNCGTNSQ